jgi:hypothetical protein
MGSSIHVHGTITPPYSILLSLLNNAYLPFNIFNIGGIQYTIYPPLFIA